MNRDDYQQQPQPSEPLSEEELLALQRDLMKREVALREQAITLELAKNAYESESRTRQNEYVAMQRELRDLRLNSLDSSSPRFTNRSYSAPYGDIPRPEPVNYVIKQAVEFIPTFDGSNMTVLQFVRACKRAREAVPPQAEETVTKLIRNKLRGRAYAAVEDADYSTISDLCNRLKDVLGPHRFVDQYRGDLASITQGPYEHILDFITRVKDLRTAILDCDRNDPNIDEIDKFAKDCFIRGLIPALRAEVRPHQSGKLNEVFDEAIIAYRQYERDNTRYGSHFREEHRRVKFTDTKDRTPAYNESWRNTNPSYSRNQPRPPLTPNRYEPPDTRRDADMPTRNVRPVSTPYHAKRETYPTEAPKYCRYCKKPGHDIHECRRREYNNNLNQGNEPGLPNKLPPSREA